MTHNKIKWTYITAISSFSILVIALLVNQYRDVLLGYRKGYAGHNFAFNFEFFLPAIFISLILGLMAFGRVLKHWKEWNDLKQKLVIMAFSLPVILLFLMQFIRLYYLYQLE